MYKNPWKHKGRNFYSKDIGDAYGFVYLIVNKKSGRKYIGRKYFWSYRKPKGKKRRVRNESNWKEYYGSSKELLADVAQHGISSFRREILSLHPSAALVNYHEVKEQFIRGVLETDQYYNNNINGKWQWVKHTS